LLAGAGGMTLGRHQRGTRHAGTQADQFIQVDPRAAIADWRL
jgi:hypothetical protein